MSKLLKSFGVSNEQGISKEREKEAINRILKIIFEWKLEYFSLLFFEAFKPRALFLSQVSMMSVAPFLDIIGFPGFEYSEILGKTENIEYILTKIEERNQKTH